MWDSETTSGVLVYGFLGFEYLFCLKALICLLFGNSARALVCLKWNFGYGCSLLALLSFKNLIHSLLFCSHRESSVFIIWALCHLKLVKIIHINLPIPPFRGFNWRELIYLRLVFVLGIVLYVFWNGKLHLNPIRKSIRLHFSWLVNLHLYISRWLIRIVLSKVCQMG